MDTTTDTTLIVGLGTQACNIGIPATMPASWSPRRWQKKLDINLKRVKFRANLGRETRQDPADY